MHAIKAELMLKLIRHGITLACGKPLKEATLDELRDEWGRFTLQSGSRKQERNN